LTSSPSVSPTSYRRTCFISETSDDISGQEIVVRALDEDVHEADVQRQLCEPLAEEATATVCTESGKRL